MDLTVEESGAPALLAVCMAREHPVDALHISCHGANSPGPVLMLESEEGDKAPIGPGALTRSPGGAAPRLLFVSAFMTSEPDAFLNSFSSEMIRRGRPRRRMGRVRGGRGGHAVRIGASPAHGAVRRPGGGGRTVPPAPAEAGQGRRGRRSRFEGWHLARLYLGQILNPEIKFR